MTTQTLTDQTAEAMQAIARAEQATGTAPRAEAPKPRRTTRKSTGARSTKTTKKAAQRRSQGAKRAPSKALAQTKTRQPAPTKPAAARRAVIDADTAAAISERLLAVQARHGISLRQLAVLIFGDESMTFPTQRFRKPDVGRGYVDQLDTVTGWLDAVERGAVELPVRAPRAPRASQLAEVLRQVEAARSLLDAVMQRRASAGERKLAASVLDLLGDTAR